MENPQAHGVPPEMVQPPTPQPGAGSGNVYDRIEEITENIIDEKWDVLVQEVKKIIEWKQSVEAKQKNLESNIEKLKEDFSRLHEGVLGRLSEYDNRMQDVGAELKAVGKVFKDHSLLRMLKN